MKIRKAVKKDLKIIGKLMKKEFAKPPFNEKDSLKSILKSLNFYFQIGQIYIALVNKEIVGVIVFKKEQYWEGLVFIIEDLAIDDNYKNKGIGKNLMKYIESIAKQQKVRLINFKTHKKSKSIKFYQKQRYKIDKNVILMEKRLK